MGDCHEMGARIEKELGEQTLKAREDCLRPKKDFEINPVGVFELDGGGLVTMVRSPDDFYSFNLRQTYPERDITRRKFAELIRPTVVQALARTAQSG